MAYLPEQAFNGRIAVRPYPSPTTCHGQAIQVQIPVCPVDRTLYQNHVAYQSNGPAAQIHAPGARPILQRPVSPVQISYPAQSNRSQPSKTPLSPIDDTAKTVNDGSASPAAFPEGYQLMLLSLAEDYIAAAHEQASTTASKRRNGDLQIYYKLIATGLGCLEAVLKHWRLQPRLEAVVRWRYATILHEETENVMEAEEALSKGITICDRHRLLDLKYNMQHLLARVMFTTNPRASLKFVDGIIKDVEAYQHTPWVYAYRFLRVSLCLELSTHQDTISALNQIRNISAWSMARGDMAILATASTFEALIHLRDSSSAESIEQAHRALAAARSSQLDPALGHLPQLSTLTHFADLCCSLQRFDPAQALTKMQAMQATLEERPQDSAWVEDGSFAIPLKHIGKPQQINSQSGLVRSRSDGSLVLMFAWMPREDIYSLGYLLSSAAINHRNSFDGQKAEQMLKDGMLMQDGTLEGGKLSESCSSAASRNTWRRVLQCYMQLYLAFTLCARSAWSSASDKLLQLKERISDLRVSVTQPLTLLIRYLEGIIHQGTGDLDAALFIFQSPMFSLPTSQPPPTPNLHLDLSILSTFSTILIINSQSHPQHHILDHLLTTLAPLCDSNPSRNILAAYNLVRATAHPNSTTGIMRTKQYLQYALQASKTVANNQIICITLTFMSWKFFRGVVGEQAEKSARACLNVANKTGDRLWMSVAEGTLAETLDVQGRGQEAEAVREEGRVIAEGLPAELMRGKINGTDGGV